MPLTLISPNSLVLFSTVQYRKQTRSEQTWKHFWLISQEWVGKTGKETVSIIDGLILEGRCKISLKRAIRQHKMKNDHIDVKVWVIFGVFDLASQTFFWRVSVRNLTKLELKKTLNSIRFFTAVSFTRKYETFFAKEKTTTTLLFYFISIERPGNG